MQVQAALIVMSIMGCDDSGSQCVMLAESQPKWDTVAECDAASEGELQTYSNVNYPVIVAVCQTQTTVASAQPNAPEAQPSAAAELTEAGPPEPDAKEQSPRTLVELMSNLADKAAPLTNSVKSVLIDKPVHVVKDSYSWVVRKLH
ncbi:hypothetical protein [Rhizobium sp. L1K21]|uniref:hypothetical protein n=1 Tax=Rhizobium sp. L1K21 TaxID=2954933 RepID=UPI00209206ED|nr:hypothetical protein [Rhizobium sp. L1K21]MCO6186291.1 hypothetical protein [Rhizobium sp. L1K21]